MLFKKSFISISFQPNSPTLELQDLHRRGKLPIIVGGTNYYIEALLWNFVLPPISNVTSPNDMSHDHSPGDNSSSDNSSSDKISGVDSATQVFSRFLFIIKQYVYSVGLFAVLNKFFVSIQSDTLDTDVVI